jgi:hypothetical protein
MRQSNNHRAALSSLVESVRLLKRAPDLTHTLSRYAVPLGERHVLKRPLPL